MISKSLRTLKGPFKGRTHPPRYSFHKYWARKPSNVIEEHLEHYTEPGDLVLDPFCGSGVSVIEALILGRRAIGIDLNPIAVEIASITMNPPEESDLHEAFEYLQQSVGVEIKREMQIPCPRCGSKVDIKYRVWASVATCPHCSNEQVLARPGEKTRRISFCAQCKGRLSSSSVTHDRLFSLAVDCKDCATKNSLFTADGISPLAKGLGEPFICNERIMSYKGLCLGDLFIEENWRHLTSLKRAVSNLSGKVKRVFSLILTANLAQASRLIPYRKNLSSGGPAWTVPGFWVPKLHLQMNLWRSFTSRFKRVSRAMKDSRLCLFTDRAAREGRVELGDARSTGLEDESVDYIITDPPYGDSVPYLEFSQLWTSFLSTEANYEREIVISNSKERKKDLPKFARELEEAFKEMWRVLKRDRFLTCFFQNRSLSVWKALGDAAHSAGFHLDSVGVLEPAVVSAKSQLARLGSLTGDVVLQFRKLPRGWSKSRGKPGDWMGLARKTAVLEKNRLGDKASFEALATAVLIELWREGMICGEGDLASLLSDFIDS